MTWQLLHFQLKKNKIIKAVQSRRIEARYLTNLPTNLHIKLLKSALGIDAV